MNAKKIEEKELREEIDEGLEEALEEYYNDLSRAITEHAFDEAEDMTEKFLINEIGLRKGKDNDEELPDEYSTTTRKRNTPKN